MGYKKFRPQRNNANKHTERGLALLEKSVQRDGWMGAITVAADGETFDGSARLETVANVMGESEPIVIDIDGTKPVIIRRTDIPDADDPRAKRLAVAANSIAAIDWNPDGALLNVLAEEDDAIKQLVKNDDAAIKAMLEAENAPNEEADAEPQIDRAAELQEKWQTARGQLWAIGDHRLLCGDSTVRADVERVMGGEKADMVFEDPPYNVAGEGRNYAADAPTQKKTYEALKNSEWDKDFDIKPHLELLLEFMAEDCAVYICTSHWLVQAIWEWMWEWSKFCSYCVWCKPNPAPSLAKRHWNFSTELIPYAVRGKHIANYPATGHALSWWEIVSPSRTQPHPTQKPIPIPTRAIEFSSNAGAIVADFFAGSGTTLVACQNLNRKCRSIEISPNYCAVILERMATAFPGIDIHLITDATH